MKIRHIIIVSLILSIIISQSLFAATEAPSTKSIKRNFDPSYVTAGAGINFKIKEEKDGDKIEKKNRKESFKSQVMEAHLNHYLHWFDFPKIDWDWGIYGTGYFTMKLRLRMYSEESAPVKTPSFMPRFTYYLWFGDNQNVQNHFVYFSFMASHHSNGQSGEFYNPDGTVNTENGSFSTNYMEPALNYFIYQTVWFKVAYDYHIDFNRENQLKDQYEKQKILFRTRFISPKIPYVGVITVGGTVSYITKGRKYIQSPVQKTAIHDEILPIEASRSDNFNYQAEFHWNPPFFEEISFFAKYDYGYDYYNIHFQEKINRIQFGFSGLTD